MNNRGQRVPPPGLTAEPPMVFRPHLAARVGLNEAIVLERAHELQRTQGQRHRVRQAGGELDVVCFRWPLYAQVRDFPFWSERTVRRVMQALAPGPDDSTPSPHVAEPPIEGQPLLWQFSVRVAGRVSRDWYSVNYGAVGDSSQLFPAAADDPTAAATPADDGQPDRSPGSDRPAGVANLTARPGQSGHGPRPTWPLPVGGKGGVVRGPSSSSLQSDSNPSARALDRQSGGQDGRRAAAADALVGLGVESIDAAELVGRHPDAPARALVAVDNARRLVEAGWRFEQAAKNWVIACLRTGARRLTDEDVRERVAWQRGRGGDKRRGGGGGDFNVPSEAAVRAERERSHRDRELDRTIDQLGDEQWQALSEKLKPRWAVECPGRPFPTDPRIHPRVRAIARRYLGGPAVRSEATR